MQFYTAGNEGKYQTHVSMNRNERGAVGWNHANKIALNQPEGVVGSLGWQFGDILPDVGIWFCPLAPMNPDSGQEGLVDGVFRTIQ